jgi:multiple sugar transport system substrate-binding protein
MTTKLVVPRPGATRRALLQTAALGMATAPWLYRPVRAQGQFDWKRYKGQSIEVVLAKGPRADVLQRFENEFTELTGIEVGSEQIPEQQQRQKLVIEFTSGSTSFDVAMVSWHVQKRLFAKGGWLKDLRAWLEDPTMTSPDYDFGDFSKAGVLFATQPDGRIDTLPLNIDYWIVYWNQELFAAKGLEYPKNFEEMLAAAKALNDPANGVAGWVSRGLKNANVPVWTSFLLGWDVDTIDASGAMHTDGPQAVAAAELYQQLNASYAPAGVVGFNWNECQSSFMQGKVGMWFDGIGFAPPLEDPTKSRIVGKVGYGVMPPGPKAQHAGMFGDGMGVSAFSEKQEAAYFYCQWATSKQMQARVLQAGGGSPPRNSAYTNQEAVANLKVPHAWIDALVESGKIGRPALPVIVPVTEFRDIFGIALTNMIGDADPKAELQKATEQFKPILEKSEKA